MWAYLRKHEHFIESALIETHDVSEWEELLAFHRDQLSNLQHERIVHLLVTLAFSLYFLLIAGFALFNGTLMMAALTVLTLTLVVAYIVHYFRLENGIQRLYHLGNRLVEKRGWQCARYDNPTIDRNMPPPQEDKR